MDANTLRLRDIRQKHKLTNKEIATILSREDITVRQWASGKHNTIPKHMLDLLELKLAARSTERGVDE